MTDVFISYSRKNNDFARKLTDRLQESGKESWVDWEGIPLSSPNWWNEITIGIDNADNFVFIMSPESISSVVCNMELDYALDLNKRVIIVVYEAFNEEEAKASLKDFEPDAAMQDRLDNETIMEKLVDNLHRISHINWLFFLETDNFDEKFRTLILTIETDLDYVKSHTRFLTRAQEWIRENKRRDLLLSGEDIVNARKWLTKADHYSKQSASGKVDVVNPLPRPLHYQYIETSSKAELQGKRIRQTTQIAIVILIIAFISSLFLRDAIYEQLRPWIDSSVIVVSTTEQLIEAIETANSSPDTIDTILITANLQATTPHDTYAFDSRTDISSAFPKITADLIIDGRNFRIHRDASSDPFNFFYVDGTGETSTSLTLINITLEGGQSISGGAIIVDATRNNGQANLIIENSTFIKNNSDGNGGAIATFSINGTISSVITNTIFDNNEAVYGGAFYAGGFDGGNNLTEIVNTSFNANHAIQAGGAIYNNGQGRGNAIMIITDESSFTNNNSDEGGGAIVNDGQRRGTGIVMIRNTEFAENSASWADTIFSGSGEDGTAVVVLENENIDDDNPCGSDDSGLLVADQC